MSTGLAKTSKIINGATSGVRGHFDILDRAREIYLAQIHRAEFEYYERVKRATALLHGEEAPIVMSAPAPEASQQAANA